MITPKSPFNTLLCNASAIACTVVLSVGVGFLDHTRFRYWNSAINELGPMNYIGLFFFFRNALAYFIARQKGSCPHYFHKEFLVYAFFPLVMLVLGVLFGTASTIASCAEVFSGATDDGQKSLAMRMALRSFGASADFSYVQLLACLGSFVFYCLSLALPCHSGRQDGSI